MIDNVQSIVGFVDYCCADKISLVEITNMARQLKISEDGCTFWWLDRKCNHDELVEIKFDLDALFMASSVDCTRVIYMYTRKSKAVVNNSSSNVVGNPIRSVGASNGGASDGLEECAEGEEEDEEEEEADLEAYIIGNQGQENEEDKDNDFHDPDYNFNSDEEAEPVGNCVVPEPYIAMEGEIIGVGCEELEDSSYASKELHSCSSTDDEEIDPVRPKYQEFNEECDMRNPEFKIGMKFRSFAQFKEAVRNYGINNRYVMNFKPNNKKRCKAFCRKGCPFYLWAAPMVKDKSTIQIKSGVLKHECTREHNIRHVNAKWVAKHYMEQFRSDPSWKISGIIQAVKTNQEANISRLTAWRAKCIALRLLDGDEKTQMSRLYDYRLELMRTHPGSTVMFKCNEGVFEAMYIYLAPLKAGFLAGCRHIISVDGCFLKGLYGGQLLAAVGIDANDCIYPVAWAVVSKENYENWVWFLELLTKDLEITNSYQWAFMSDRQKGLIPAIQQLFPHSEHRYCVRHIYTNFRKTHKGKALKDQLWTCARASYIPAFNQAMEALNEMSAEAYRFLKNIEPHHWSRSHFQTQFKCDMLLNNLSECFNNNILEARTKGIVTMNEMIRTKLMMRIQKNRDAIKKCTTLHCPKIVKKLEKLKQLSWFYSTIWSREDKYQVLGSDGQFVVDIKERACTCRRWQLTGLPCSHAISAIFHNKDRPEHHVDDCYKVTTFMQTYNHLLSPTQDSVCWPKSNGPLMIPPEPANKKRGRRPMLRRREADEEYFGFTNGRVSRKGVGINCSICGMRGHNKRYHGKKDDKNDPMDAIDPQVLQEHFAEVDLLSRGTGNEEPMAANHASTENVPQVLNISDEAVTKATPAMGTRMKWKKLAIRRGKSEGNTTTLAKDTTPPKRPPPTATFPVLRSNMKDNAIEDRSKAVGAKKRRKAWVPPGFRGHTSSSTAYGGNQ